MGARAGGKIRWTKSATEMIRWVIISNFVFLVANITWIYTGDPKFFYVPLALLLVAFNYYILKSFKGKGNTILFLEYFLWLSYGNLIKQLFYSETLKQINDYAWGSLMTIYLIYKLWATRKHHSGIK